MSLPVRDRGGGEAGSGMAGEKVTYFPNKVEPPAPAPAPAPASAPAPAPAPGAGAQHEPHGAGVPAQHPRGGRDGSRLGN